MAGITDKLDKAHENTPVDDLAKLPVSALQAVTDADAEHLQAAFGIKTIGDLGTNKHFPWAHAIATLAE